MTASLRRGPRRCQPNHLSHRLAAIRHYGAAHLGTVKAYLLGKNRFREVVALALFLIAYSIPQSIVLYPTLKAPGLVGGGEYRYLCYVNLDALSTYLSPQAISLHNISYQTLRFKAYFTAG
jgi:hypothetical protein